MEVAALAGNVRADVKWNAVVNTKALHTTTMEMDTVQAVSVNHVLGNESGATRTLKIDTGAVTK